MGIELKSVDRSYRANFLFCIVLLVVLILSHTGFAFELLTFESTTAKYTYYLNAANEQVKHGTDTRYYTYPTVSQIIHWNHGQQHGLDEAWYRPHYSYGYVKHWEKNYQNGVLHGSSKQWTQSTGQIESFTNYRYGLLDGVYQKWRSAPDFSQYNPYYFHMHENATYKNGLLHGAYTKWITTTYTSYGYTYYNQRIKDQEGNYAYGKKDGKWKFYHSTESSPYFVKSEGYYSNDNKCGDWRYYYATTGGLASTEDLGPCGATYPPGGGGPLPGGYSRI
ncbi:hypothetical protein [Desulfobacula sp.]|uniref:hypothetical protein n=1 Tax=Desulfobacula sp. TaxID=2593537 RepID=UPI002610CEA6|nr:hypothetical protein [Desulfobacula sp.]